MRCTITKLLGSGEEALATSSSAKEIRVYIGSEKELELWFPPNENRDEWINGYEEETLPLPIFTGDEITAEKRADGFHYVTSVILDENDRRHEIKERIESGD